MFKAIDALQHDDYEIDGGKTLAGEYWCRLRPPGEDPILCEGRVPSDVVAGIAAELMRRGVVMRGATQDALILAIRLCVFGGR